MAGFAPQLQSALRIVAAFMVIQTGAMKLFAFPMGMPPDGSTANRLTQVGISGILATFGGALLLLGLFTRPWPLFSRVKWRWHIFNFTRRKVFGLS